VYRRVLVAMVFLAAAGAPTRAGAQVPGPADGGPSADAGHDASADPTAAPTPVLVPVVIADAAPAPAPSPELPLEHDPGQHRWASAAILGGIYVPLTVWAYFAWYYDQPDLPAFKVGGDGLFGERTYAGGADKMGHFWINHTLSLGTAQILRWGGFRPLAASALASGLSFGFFFFVEIKDGYYYEFSPGDLVANGLGALTAAAMVNFPRFDELVDVRMQYLPSDRFRTELADGNVDVAEDYSGQTFAVALHLGALPYVKGSQAESWLRFVDLSVGFESRGYKPDPPDGEPEDRSQRAFVGVSLNLQGVVDAALEGRASRAARIGRKIGHGFLEVFQVPYTTLPVARTSRSPDN
jgi:hypothetical protein